jgi:hypothetical protein
MPCFVAAQEKSFVGMGLGCLMTAHSQVYPQVLGINDFCPDF